jgi:hypothetical protein
MAKKKKVEKTVRGPKYEVYTSKPEITIRSTDYYSMQYVKMSIEEAEEVLEQLRKTFCEVPR